MKDMKSIALSFFLFLYSYVISFLFSNFSFRLFFNSNTQSKHAANHVYTSCTK